MLERLALGTSAPRLQCSLERNGQRGRYTREVGWISTIVLLWLRGAMRSQ